ncbi:hypothetical protein [Diaminobutyricimonas sp. LJ205]|uniref:HAAS signaling domain-containing protein n=1 Tax=Diaminobutyricimonas sp. LJ205 TaxID=2683590 RepID=UPI0012F4D04B|nr:hypothetical protein [Diaminobutyricimonas sp. LJ205]
MTETQPTPQVVRSYLAQLEAALVGVPDSVSRDIRAGVAEELTGLDAAAAAARIEELGDPAFIAAEARAEAGAPPVIVAPPAAAPAGDSRAYTIIAALLVALGGILVPVLGWIVGIAMVWMSRTWSLGEKLVATLTGPASVLLAAGVAASVSLSQDQTVRVQSGEPQNPVLPALFDIWWSSALLLVLVNVVVGMWLLWRARGRL